MSSISFTDYVTVIPATWLNDVNTVVWTIFGGATTVAGARHALGLDTADNPTFGNLTVTKINKVTITQPATGATLTIADGKTIVFNNSITFAGTDSTTMTFPSTSKTIMANDGSNLAIGSDANGDMYYRAAGVLARLAVGAANKHLFVNAGGTAPEWASAIKVGGFTRDVLS